MTNPAGDPPICRPRRRLLGLGMAGAAGLPLWGCTSLNAPPPTAPLKGTRTLSPSAPVGRLMVIGGAEKRVDPNDILERFISLSGGPPARLCFITAASGDPEGTAAAYREAMENLQARNLSFVHIHEAADSYHPALLQQLQAADGIFITGGDQKRLMGKLWHSPVMQTLHESFRERGICIAGTSAGAAAMSRAMIAQGPAVVAPEKEAISLDLGLNLLPQALVDQHFSQRRRMSRLLSAVAQRADLLGIGIDEDTALLIESGRAIEVMGKGTVTIVDGTGMVSNARDIKAQDRLELSGVLLHVLPSGRRYALLPDEAPSADAPAPPPPLQPVLARLVEPAPIVVF